MCFRYSFLCSASCSLVVTNIADSGVGSLREAINCANAVANIDRRGTPAVDPDPITFNIANPPTDAVSWWKAENDATDSIDSNNGTLMNGTTFAPGKVGQAFSFDGVNDDVEVPHNTNLDPTGSFSVSERPAPFGSLPVAGTVTAEGNVTTVGVAAPIRPAAAG